MTSRRLLAVTAALLVLLAGCTGGGGGGSSASPDASVDPSASAGACAATPEPAPEAVSAWQGAQAPSVFPLIIDPGVLACGENRMMFSFLDDQNLPVASPDRTVQVAVYDLGASTDTPVATADAEFIWAIEDERGVYVANVELPTSGLYGAEFTTQLADAAPESIKVTFESRPERAVVSVGDPAPGSDTPTLDDVGGDVAKISTDDQPVKAFYQASIADALAAKEPFVVVFATPKFCATEQCGPTLDKVKPIAKAHPDVTFINVEPYQLEEVEGQLQPVLTDGALTAAAATDEWKLPSEPWIFVVDREGIVQASFMLIVGDDELEAAIEAVS